MTAIDWSLYPNFSEDEFRCKCGCGQADMNPTFLGILQTIRTIVNEPLVVSSGYRCPEHNNRVSSTGRDGPHTTGRAVDLAVSHGLAHKVIAAALATGITGLGVNQKGRGRFLHLDDLPEALGRPRPTVWSY